jgi:GTP-binding protein
LKAYHPSLQEKMQRVALNKIDLPLVQERAANIKNQFEKMGYRLYFISAQTGKGVKELMEAVSRALESISDQVNE